MKQVIFILIIAVYCLELQAQCETKNSSFKANEVIEYHVVYDLGLFWTEAGLVTFKVEEAVYENQEVFHLKSFGKSHKKYDWIYKVRDFFGVYVDKETMLPLHFFRDTYEGGYKVDNEYKYDYQQKTIFSTIETSKSEFFRDTLKMNGCTFDILSAVYQIRNNDFSGMEKDDKIPIPILLDNSFFNLYIRFIGREKITTENKRVFNCLKFKVKLVAGTIFKGGEDVTIWVSDDENRVPILVEAEILVGKVKATLKSTKNLRHEFTSEEK